MYDIRQFKPALYTLIILGMTGFALAAGSPGLWVISVGATVLNAWLIRTGRFRPLPRLVANLVTILALGYVVMLVVTQSIATPILVVGQFLVLLQIVKLFEQRANRDYAQLLVLSLLLVVAASISTASLVFGIVLVVYLFLSLYVCLLFHLKVESDHAKLAIGLPDERINPATLRMDQRYLSRSMRRLTGIVSIIAITMAVFVFLAFPRSPASNLFGSLQFRPSQTLTGFSDQLQFQNVARITQNPAVVAYVNVWHNDKPVDGTMPLLLRGKTLQVYAGNDPAGGGAWQWSRTAAAHTSRDLRPGSASFLEELEDRNKPREDVWRQRITLEPTGTPVLFALAGAFSLTPVAPFDGRVLYSPDDQVLQMSDPLYSRVTYEVSSTNQLTDAGPLPTVIPERFRDPDRRRLEQDAPLKSRIDPRIEQLAREPDVSGSDERGLLAGRRDPAQRVTPLDLAIASHMERYLRQNFQYTLDLTDAVRAAGEDPMVAFLYDFKRGHCEYFAGAMTLMAQSLGLQARVVIGFKSDEFNNIGGYYIVRQAHAHAWVEVLGDDGLWHTFDPTSARQAAATSGGWWQRMKHLFNFLEFTWANSVVAYDRESRTNILRTTEESLVTTAIRSTNRLNEVKELLSGPDAYLFSSRFLSVLIGLMITGLVAAVLWYAFEKWRLRRRARRIGLDSLPPQDQLRLARQLGFYDELLRLLERHRIIRPRHLTPMEFSQSITFLPAEAFDRIRRLTEIFYRVRFGHAELSPRKQAHLAQVIDQLEHALHRPQV